MLRASWLHSILYGATVRRAEIARDVSRRRTRLSVAEDRCRLVARPEEYENYFLIALNAHAAALLHRRIAAREALLIRCAIGFDNNNP